MEYTPTSIKDLRERSKKTQKEFAILLKVDRRTISRYEKGNMKPGREVREKLDTIEESLRNSQFNSEGIHETRRINLLSEVMRALKHLEYDDIVDLARELKRKEAERIQKLFKGLL